MFSLICDWSVRSFPSTKKILLPHSFASLFQILLTEYLKSLWYLTRCSDLISLSHTHTCIYHITWLHRQSINKHPYCPTQQINSLEIFLIEWWVTWKFRFWLMGHVRNLRFYMNFVNLLWVIWKMRRRAADFRRPVRRNLSCWISSLLGLFCVAGFILFTIHHFHAIDIKDPVRQPTLVRFRDLSCYVMLIDLLCAVGHKC